MQRCTERVYIVRFRRCKFANGHIKAMHEIHKLILRKALEQVTFQMSDRVPSHMRHFIFMLLRNKTLHRNIKNAQTIDLSLFGTTAHQLHPQTNSQYRLPQIFYQFIHSAGPKMFHRRLRFSHSGKNHLIGSLQHLLVSSNHRFYPKTFQGIIH